ncbi:MAG: nucleotide triphosphate diphosphatase NUDT15 [Alphaproteobacteria bacterium]
MHQDKIQNVEKYPRVGVGTFIYNEKGQILLGHRIAGHDSDTWTLVGGHLEFGESFEDCSRRETLEETGIKLYQPQLMTCVNDLHAESGQHFVSIFMKAKIKSGIARPLEPHKYDAWKWYFPDEFPENVFFCMKNLFSTQPEILRTINNFS